MFSWHKYGLLFAQTLHPLHVSSLGCLLHIFFCKNTPLCLFADIQAEVGFATGSSCTEWCLITQTSDYCCYSLQLWRRPVADPEAKGKGKYRREDQEPEVNLLWLMLPGMLLLLPPVTTLVLVKKISLFGLPWQLCRFLDPGWDPLSFMEKEMPWRRKCSWGRRERLLEGSGVMW